MRINSPNDLESRLAAAVQLGRFASIDEATAEAARLLLRKLDRDLPQADDARNPGQPPPRLDRGDAGRCPTPG